MKTIIAATDMSANSRPALRFALQLAATMNAKLFIVNVYHVLRASMWTDAQYEFYRNKTQQVLMNELETFVKSVRPQNNYVAINYESELFHHLDTVDGIIEYAREKHAVYICAGTHGAGVLAKLIGTNTARLISHSEIPVIAVPGTFRQRRISRVLYASDMSDYNAELQKVLEFVRPLHARVTLLHLYHAYEFVPDKELMEQSLEQTFRYKINVLYVQRNTRLRLDDDIQQKMKKLNPSLFVMFTNQERDYIERLIAGSNTRSYSFISKVPMLSLPKRIANAREREQVRKGVQIAA